MVQTRSLATARRRDAAAPQRLARRSRQFHLTAKSAFQFSDESHQRLRAKRGFLKRIEYALGSVSVPKRRLTSSRRTVERAGGATHFVAGGGLRRAVQGGVGGRDDADGV